MSDTRVANGAAMISDELWADVPMVNAMGHHFSYFVSACILKAIVMSELITPNLASYQDLAVRMAQDADFLFPVRKNLQINRRAKPLFNAACSTRNLENA